MKNKKLIHKEKQKKRGRIDNLLLLENFSDQEGVRILHTNAPARFLEYATNVVITKKVSSPVIFFVTTRDLTLCYILSPDEDFLQAWEEEVRRRVSESISEKKATLYTFDSLKSRNTQNMKEKKITSKELKIAKKIIFSKCATCLHQRKLDPNKTPVLTCKKFEERKNPVRRCKEYTPDQVKIAILEPTLSGLRKDLEKQERRGK